MVRIRRALGRVAVAWCLCQIAGMTVAPTILLAWGAEALECTCAHGDHALCPMHHPRTGTRTCALATAGSAGDLPGALPGLADLVIPSAAVAHPQLAVTAPPPDPVPLLGRSVSPDLRPPRP